MADEPIDIFQELILTQIEIIDSDSVQVKISDDDETILVSAITTQGLVGPVAFIFRGPWVSTEVYPVRQIVLYQGSLFINNSTETIAENILPVYAPWSLFLPKGNITIDDLTAEAIPNLPASKITSGVLDENRLPANLRGTTSNVQDQLDFIASNADAYYVHNQMSPSTTWTVNHNLNKFPSISIVDSTGREVESDIVYVDANNVLITHPAAFSGKGYCN